MTTRRDAGKTDIPTVKQLLVVACMGERIPLEEALGLELGDADDGTVTNHFGGTPFREPGAFRDPLPKRSTRRTATANTTVVSNSM